MSWLINGSTPDSLKLAVARVDVGTGMIDTATLETMDDWDTAPLAYGDWVTIAANSSVLIWGMVTKDAPYAMAGGRQGRRYTISGPQWHLERAPYTQPFTYATSATTTETKDRSKCWIGIDPSTGDRCDTRAALGLVLGAAIAAGVPMTYNISSADIGTVLAPPFEVTDQVCSSVMQQILRWHPGCFTWWAYSSGSAVLHIAKSSGAVSFDVTSTGANVPVQVDVTARHDMIPEGITIRWERVNVFEVTGDSSQNVQRIEQKTESAGTAAPALGVLMYTIELKGSETQFAEQAIVARTVPDDVLPDDGGPDLDADIKAKVLAWYGNHTPALAALPVGSLQVEEHTRVINLPQWAGDDDQRPDEWDVNDGLPAYDEEADPGALPRELVDGTVPEWARWIKAEPMLARLKVKWNGEGDPTEEESALAEAVFGSGLDLTRTFEVSYTGTNARSKRYSGLIKFIAAEDWPAEGLAAQVLSALQDLAYEGTITVGGAEVYTSAKPGVMLSLSGGRTGSGVVQRVTWDGASKRTQIQFGFAGHLMVPDFIELQRAARTNGWTASYDKKRQQDAKPTSKGAAQGSARHAKHNTTSPDAGGSASCAFTGIVVGDTFKFTTSGTLNSFEPENMHDGPVDLLELSLTTLPCWIVLHFTSTDNDVQSCDLVVRTDTPEPVDATEGTAPGEFDDPLYYINEDGRAQRLIGCASRWATPIEVMQTSNPTPTPCGDSVVRWWNWKVEEA